MKSGRFHIKSGLAMVIGMAACLVLFALLMCASPVRAAVIVPVGVNIPDSGGSGLLSTTFVSGQAGSLAGVDVTLEITGGFNGDYYAYVWHAGRVAILLNRAGVSTGNPFGYAQPGFGADGLGQSFTFSDQAAQDVHFYQNFGAVMHGSGQVSGMWQPDGRIILPDSSPATFDSADRPNRLSVFNGMDPNGEWRFYIEDVSPLSQGTLVNWELAFNVASVPESGQMAMSLVTLLGICGCFLWRRRRPGIAAD